MPILYLMIGAPASGKTTVAMQIRAATNGFLICPDLIRERFSWPNVKVFDYAYHRMGLALKHGRNVILDATSTVPEHRARAMRFGQAHSADVIGVWLDTPLVVCLQRHEQRRCNQSQSTLTPDIIRRYHQHLQAHPPSLIEGYTRLIRVTITDNPLKKLNLVTPPTT